MAELRKVADVSEVPPGQMKLVEANGQEIVLVNLAGTFYAIGAECTHRRWLLSEGELSGESVICAGHGGQFNVKTGEVESPPPADPVPTYQVTVEGTEVKIALP